MNKLNLQTTFGSLIIILFVSSSCFEFLSSPCPELLSKFRGACQNFKCNNPVTKEQCPMDTIYIHNASMCGCCPQCVKFLSPTVCDEDNPDCEPDVECVKENTPDVNMTPSAGACSDTNHCPLTFNINTCLPGLICNDAKKCELPPKLPMEAEKDECMFRKSLTRLGLHHWEPDCEENGAYAPKQCKGSLYDGECFCVNPSGKRIFGREWYIDAENQTCACSRQVNQLRTKNNFISTIHCSSDGNYEPLQCDSDSGLCYCVDPLTGKLDGGVVPEVQWKSLHCFTLNATDGHTDGKYLRKCESKYAALKDLQITGSAHGTEVRLGNLACDFDGSYAPRQIKDTISECVFKNGSRVLDFFLPQSTAQTCNCARDVYEYFPDQLRTTNLYCQSQIGNYDIAYDFGSYASCVDSDGFLYGEIVDSKYMCCLLKEGCAAHIDFEICFNGTAGIKRCTWWWFNN